MSQENVELVRTGIDAYNRRDLNALLQHMASDFVFDMSRAIGPQRGVYDQVVVPVTAHARGRDGIEITADTASVYTLRDGELARLTMYQGRQEALEAAGLSE